MHSAERFAHKKARNSLAIHDMPELALPKENDAQLVVRVPKELKRRLMAAAKRHKSNASRVHRAALERGLAEIEKEAA